MSPTADALSLLAAVPVVLVVAAALAWSRRVARRAEHSRTRRRGTRRPRIA